ncbi:MAG: divergent polysaccharide deacetylase family protein [Kangiellaceae bacterium]|nr:divergent polysaccharide deacetylase family protein [Kangiellaceae bacterium]MCW9015686.1 divergent polysaccharide deacetylase family protein [Kangiellaceae bacterium]
MSRLLYIFFIALLSPAQANDLERNYASANQAKPKISIVVDDLGDNSIIAKQITELPVNLTMAILPKTPHAQKISNWAHQNGHEVIMHLPMEASSRPDLLGPGAIFSDMSQDQITDIILENARSIPHLVGINNHMGSLLTKDVEKMTWVMSLAKSQNWYFLDSKTSEESIAQDIALKNGLPNLGRDIFLDHHSESQKGELPKIIKLRMNRALSIAQREGHVVVICHPYAETLAFFEKHLAALEEQYEFVRASDLLSSDSYQIASKKQVPQSGNFNR